MTKPAAPVYPGYVSLNRPYIVDAAGGKSGDIQFGESGKPFRDAIRSGKFDGAIIKNTGDEGDVYVTLDPTQFKSRFNAGTFDPSDPNFLKSAGLMTVGAGAAAYGMSPDDAEASYIGPKGLANLLGPDAAKKLLTDAEQMAAKGVDNEAVRQATGLFQGMDGKWRYEVDDSRFKVNDVLSNLKTGGYGPKDISKVDYAVRPDGKYDATLIPHNPQRVSDLVSLTGVDDGILRSVFPDEVLGKIKSGAGEETYVGKDFLEGKSLQSPFRFEGFNALPSDVAVSHDALFKAYPDLGDVMVSVDPKTGIGGSYSLMDTGDSVIKVGTGQQPVTLLHELQHAIQQREGFARGGSPSAMSWASPSQRPDLIKVAQQTMDEWKPATYEQFWGKEVTPEGQSAYADYLKGFNSKEQEAVRWKAAQQGAPGRIYQDLAGEIEARDVAARMNLTPEQRRATPPDLRDNAIVRFDGGQAASVPQRRDWAKDAGSSTPNVAQAVAPSDPFTPSPSQLASTAALISALKSKDAPLEDTYQPADLLTAFATGGGGFVPRAIQAGLDPIFSAGVEYLPRVADAINPRNIVMGLMR